MNDDDVVWFLFAFGCVVKLQTSTAHLKNMSDFEELLYDDFEELLPYPPRFMRTYFDILDSYRSYDLQKLQEEKKKEEQEQNHVTMVHVGRPSIYMVRSEVPLTSMLLKHVGSSLFLCV